MCMLKQGCSLSMNHRTCENVHGDVRLGGLGMPNILNMPFYFKPRDITKYSILYMVQIGLTDISIKSGVVNSNVGGFLNCSGNAMVLPPHYLEVVLCGGVVSTVTVVVYRGEFL